MATPRVEVTYVGILPDLFREGQGVVALGAMRPDGTFRASEVLAKHDETYMPQGRGGRAEEVRALEPGVRPAAARRDLEHACSVRKNRRMIPELGHFALALAVVLAGAQAVLPLFGAHTARCTADGRPRRLWRSASSSRWRPPTAA